MALAIKEKNAVKMISPKRFNTKVSGLSPGIKSEDLPSIRSFISKVPGLSPKYKKLNLSTRQMAKVFRHQAKKERKV